MTAPPSNDDRPLVEAHVRGKNTFVLEGDGCGEWIKCMAPVENKQ